MSSYSVGVCTSSEQPSGVRSYIDVPRKSSTDRLNLNGLEFSVFRIGLVNCHTVVSSIRRIDEFPIRMYENLCRRVEGFSLLVLPGKRGLCGEGLGCSLLNPKSASNVTAAGDEVRILKLEGSLKSMELM